MKPYCCQGCTYPSYCLCPLFPSKESAPFPPILYKFLSFTTIPNQSLPTLSLTAIPCDSPPFSTSNNNSLSFTSSLLITTNPWSVIHPQSLSFTANSYQTPSNSFSITHFQTLVILSFSSVTVYTNISPNTCLQTLRHGNGMSEICKSSNQTCKKQEQFIRI